MIVLSEHQRWLICGTETSPVHPLRCCLTSEHANSTSTWKSCNLLLRGHAYHIFWPALRPCTAVVSLVRFCCFFSLEYYLSIRDIQMLGMLSCILCHHSLPASFKPSKSQHHPLSGSRSFTLGQHSLAGETTVNPVSNEIRFIPLFFTLSVLVCFFLLCLFAFVRVSRDDSDSVRLLLLLLLFLPLLFSVCQTFQVCCGRVGLVPSRLLEWDFPPVRRHELVPPGARTNARPSGGAKEAARQELQVTRLHPAAELPP